MSAPLVVACVVVVLLALWLEGPLREAERIQREQERRRRRQGSRY